MSMRLGPDWQKIAEGHRIEITDKQRERLETLGRTMFGLRGLIDWSEEPIVVFACPEDMDPELGERP